MNVKSQKADSVFPPLITFSARPIVVSLPPHVLLTKLSLQLAQAADGGNISLKKEEKNYYRNQTDTKLRGVISGFLM